MKSHTASAGRRREASASGESSSSTHRRGAGGKPHLTVEQIVDLRQSLMQRRVTLVGEISQLQSRAAAAGHGLAANSSWRGRGDGDDTSEDHWSRVLALVSIDRKHFLLHEIDQALARMESRTYGYDEATGAPIPLSRLREIPWARTC
jgi:RNA polymerase-binding transcription factor DksA